MLMCTMSRRQKNYYLQSPGLQRIAVETGRRMSSANPDMLLKSGDLVLTRMTLAND